MAAKLICGSCEATLNVGKEGAGVVIALCDRCKLQLRAEMKQPVFRQPNYGSRLRAA